MRRFVRSVIRRARITAGESLAALRLDPVLMRAMEVLPFEDVEIVNLATGARAAAWVEEGGDGEVCFGATGGGDQIAILSHGWLHDGQTLAHRARVVTLDESNRLISLSES